MRRWSYEHVPELVLAAVHVHARSLARLQDMFEGRQSAAADCCLVLEAHRVREVTARAGGGQFELVLAEAGEAAGEAPERAMVWPCLLPVDAYAEAGRQARGSRARTVLRARAAGVLVARGAPVR